MLPGIQEELLSIHKQHLLDRLLTDKTTKTNIIWATDAYNNLGDAYRRDKEITSDLITGHNSGVIKNRARKALEQQAERTRQHAEVFTPLWICEKMNDHIDEVWFNRKQGIHKTEPETEHILFTTNKKWTYYVDSRRLEITCGEAPYLVSRYDVSTGEAIPIEQRIGILDRKLRAVNENATTEAEWIEWAIRAFQATYGYEFQGDNVLIARVNLLMTFEEYLYDRWKRKPTEKEYQTITNIICWNIWQMDGLTGTIPYCKAEEDEPQMTFVLPGEEPAADSAVENTQPKCRIFDWRRENSIEFKILTEGDRKMKFDFIIGNPPFQDETIGENTSYAPPIFNRFMDESYKTGKIVELIHPARFLFNAGSTPKAWNKKMLADKNFKVLHYEADSARIFPGKSITGGIAITYRNEDVDFGPILVFNQFVELNSIRQKVNKHANFRSIEHMVYSAYSYHLTAALYEEHPELKGRLSKGHEFDLKSNIFRLMPEVFIDQKPSDEYIQILGIDEKKRAVKWVKRQYITGLENLDRFKIFVAGADGAAGTIGKPIPARVCGMPSIGMERVGNTESFVSIGAFHTLNEANNALKYIKTKFARTLLGILKATQANTPGKWAFVPEQDFTSHSDVDWTKSIPEIDQHLYDKYELDAKEIAFIEHYVKEMT